MKLSTGKVAFPIEFDNGDKQTIYFNPNDPDLMIRLKNFTERTKSRIENIEDVELTNEGKPVKVSQIEVFEKMQDILKSELDYAFGGNISEVVFLHCSPFAIVNGEFFVIQFVKAITPEIEKHIAKARTDVEKKISKHINKYKK